METKYITFKGICTEADADHNFITRKYLCPICGIFKVIHKVVSYPKTHCAICKNEVEEVRDDAVP